MAKVVNLCISKSNRTMVFLGFSQLNTIEVGMLKSVILKNCYIK